MRRAILDKDHKVILVDNLITWANWQGEENNRRVGFDALPNGYLVSTVFLGLDHGWGEGKPLWFETMVFNQEDPREDVFCERYETWDEAVEGHRQIVEEWKTRN